MKREIIEVPITIMRTKTIIIPVGFNAEQSEENVMHCFSPKESVEWMSPDQFLEQYLYEQKSQRPLKVWLLVSDSPGEMIVQEGRLLPALGRKCVNISTLLLWYKSQHPETTVEVIRVLPVIIDQRRVEILDEWFVGLPARFHTLDLEKERSFVPGDMPFAQFLQMMDFKAAEIIKRGGEPCIFKPVAAAIGIGLDVLSIDASMVVLIDSGTCEVAVVALGGIVASRSIQIAGALDHSISEIEEAIMSVLEITPPESSADIYKNGIYLAGGGALLRGLDKRISQATHLPVHVAADPLHTVDRGTAIALKNFSQFPFIVDSDSV